MATYWTRVSNQRLARRRFLAASATGVTAATLLAACGGSGSSSDTGGKAAGLVTNPADTTKDAKAGGVYKSQVTQDVQTFEPSFRSAASATGTARAYQNIFSQKPGHLALQPDEYEGDIIDSWEFSPDRLQLTLKVRTEGKWDKRPPTNGRNVDASDIVYTWQRFEKVASLRADLANSVNPDAPILSMSAPDSKTVVVKFARATAGIFASMAVRSNTGLWILPKESESGFDVKKDQRGSGPYVLTQYSPSTSFIFEKSDGYWNKDKVLIQRIEYPIITEYAQSLAQFKAGNVFTFGVKSEDILPTMASTPELNLFKTPITSSGFRWFFGFQDGPKSPFRDVRVRQAFSMSIDRDLYIETFYNVSKFKAAGIPIDTAWDTCVRCDATGWWLDPQGKDFGENAKYFKRDIAAAKQLLAAAGFPNGLDVDAHHITSGDYGADFPPKVQAILGMAPDSGLRVRSAPANYATDWQQKYRDVKGNFDGMAFVLNTSSGDTGDLLYALFNSNGSQFMGFTPDGSSTFKGDTFLDDLTNKMKVEFDVQKRHALAYELQRYDAKMQYYPQFPGAANGLQLVWPAVENWGVYTGGLFLEYYLWLNNQKPPLKSA